MWWCGLILAGSTVFSPSGRRPSPSGGLSLSSGGLGLRKKRADRLARCVTHVASVLPFEAEFYRRYPNLKVTYVGHPLVDRVQPQLAPEEWRQRHNVAPTEKVILLMPGSRKQEVQALLPVMLAAAAELAAGRDDLRFFLPVAPTIDQTLIQTLLAQYSGLAVTTKTAAGAYNLMAAAICEFSLPGPPLWRRRCLVYR